MQVTTKKQFKDLTKSEEVKNGEVEFAQLGRTHFLSGLYFERGRCCAECLQGDILLAGVGTFGGDVDVLCAGG